MRTRNEERAHDIVERILNSLERSTLNDLHPEAVKILKEFRVDMEQDVVLSLEFDDIC